MNAQPTLWEACLPGMCLGMPAELEAMEHRLLDAAAFFDPFRAHFHSFLGWPSVPIETYLRLIFSKYRDRLGFEPLRRDVADSISWQCFCRIPLGLLISVRWCNYSVTACPLEPSVTSVTSRGGGLTVGSAIGTPDRTRGNSSVATSPNWEIRHGSIEMFRPQNVAITRYRYEALGSPHHGQAREQEHPH